MNLSEAPRGLAERPELPSVDGLRQLQGVAVVEGAPTKSEQLARTECFGHFQHEEKTVSSLSIGQDQPSCSQLRTCLSLGRRFLGIFNLRVGSLTRNSCSMASSKMDFRYDLACLTRSCEYCSARLFRCVCSMNRSNESSGWSPNLSMRSNSIWAIFSFAVCGRQSPLRSGK